MAQDRGWHIVDCDLFYGEGYITCLEVGATNTLIGQRIKEHSRRASPELWAWYELVYDGEAGP